VAPSRPTASADEAVAAPALDPLHQFGALLASCIGELEGDWLGKAGYEAGLAAAVGGRDVSDSYPQARYVDIVVDGIGALELSNGNVFVDKVRVSELLLRRPPLPIVYAFVKRKKAGGRLWVEQIRLVRTATLSRYLDIDRATARFYLAEDAKAPSTFNAQQHLRPCDLNYLADATVDRNGELRITRRRPPRPPLRRQRTRWF
jgi:hypothetical protein